MLYPQNRNIHRPLHLFNQEAIYFITARTYKNVSRFNGYNKEILRRTLLNAIKLYCPDVYAWVILDNHYHMLLSFPEVFCCDELSPAKRDEIRYLQTRPDKDNEFRFAQFVGPDNGAFKHNRLAKFVQYIHRDSARVINKVNCASDREDDPIWHQYHDWIIRNERDFYTHLNYIHTNPIKHGLVKSLKDLKKYRYCSYKSWLDKLGPECVGEIVYKYPVKALRLDS